MVEITVCVGSSCHLKGAHDVIKQFQKLIPEYQLEDKVELKAGFCLGKCTEAVTVKVGEEYFTSLTPDDVQQVLEAVKKGAFKEEK